MNMIKHSSLTKLTMPLFFVTGVLFFGCHQKTIAKLETFQTNNGWGYQIKKNEKVYIKQENIPAVSGIYAFKSQEDAEKTGHLALEKMKRHQLPTITLQELDSLHIHIASK